ncbi:GNAT family N-acetyltransferase [Jiella sp. CQZ9-1]|uniref:GNAT family N-acetyltransferase n=1 Tax=Jiella flava TaxID=2816857 RepID=A0A939JQN3_9HYPH|nr:GNAT family N-acetyltransferase [Jiella flava]
MSKLTSDALFEAVQRIEGAAFETLRAASAVSGAIQTSSDDELRGYLDDGCLFAAFPEESNAVSPDPVGYAGGYGVAGWLQLGEVDVMPAWQKRGIGTALVQAVIGEARMRGAIGVTLTTDRFARFNAPFYALLGFAALTPAQTPPHLAAILEAEPGKGLDPQRRVAMAIRF